MVHLIAEQADQGVVDGPDDVVTGLLLLSLLCAV